MTDTSFSSGITGLAGQWGTSPGRVNELEDLANSWEQISGYQAKVSDWQLQEMAQNNNYGGVGRQISTVYDFGQYMQSHVGSGAGYTISPDAAKAMPWAFVGLRAQDYQARVSSFQSVYQDLIGRNATQDELNNAFALGKGETSASDLRQNVMQDTNMQETYGWLKFGLNYQGFQRQVADYRTQFGGDITDEQAILQLKYDHALGHVLGAYQTAQLQPADAATQKQAQPSVGALQSSTR